jgi:hypothetical protein
VARAARLLRRRKGLESKLHSNGTAPKRGPSIEFGSRSINESRAAILSRPRRHRPSFHLTVSPLARTGTVRSPPGGSAVVLRALSVPGVAVRMLALWLAVFLMMWLLYGSWVLNRPSLLILAAVMAPGTILGFIQIIIRWRGMVPQFSGRPPDIWALLADRTRLFWSMAGRQ